MDIFKSIDNCTLENTQKFRLPNKLMECKVVKVIDGDTVKAVFKPFFSSSHYVFSVRLLGSNAPETRTTNKEEKSLGLICKDYLSKTVLGKHLFIECCDFDNFGRTLAYLYTDKSKKNSINDIMMVFVEGLREQTQETQEQLVVVQQEQEELHNEQTVRGKEKEELLEKLNERKLHNSKEHEEILKKIEIKAQVLEDQRQEKLRKQQLEHKSLREIQEEELNDKYAM
jgi:hypothetical protein